MVRPAVEARGSPLNKAAFYIEFACVLARETRFRIYDEALIYARRALLAAEEGVGEHDMAICVGNLGEYLFWHGDLDEAQEKCEAALAMGERIGDPFRTSDCLCWLSLIFLRRHDVEAVRSLSARALATATDAKYPMYVAAARAAMAWVAWKDDRFDDVVSTANEALALWATIPVTFHVQGVCLWPLLAVRLARGQVSEAVDAGCRVLEPPQHRLRDELESLLRAAKEVWDRDDHRLAARKLSEALALASELGYA